jgi:hypothetical protein
MADSVRAAVLVGPGRYELQEFPYPRPARGYGPALRLLERYADRYPFDEVVTHEFGLHQADEALHTSMDPRSKKVAIVPGLTV